MKIKNLNIVLFFLFVMLLGLSSCSSDNSLQLPEVNIGSLSKFQDHAVSIPQDEVLSLSAEVKSQPAITKISWKVNGMEKASTAKFDFSASEVGSYKIVLSVTNEDGMNQECGWLGETSTEVMGAVDLHTAGINLPSNGK